MAVADFASLATPIGTIRVTADANVLVHISIDPPSEPEHAAATPLLREAVHQLQRYFQGAPDVFDLPLAAASTMRGEDLRGALIAIPFGETRSYGALAAAYASAPRAIGSVCRTNPFPIVVPCHRVVSTGKIEYYSAGAGPSTKAWLQEHERRWRERHGRA